MKQPAESKEREDRRPNRTLPLKIEEQAKRKDFHEWDHSTVGRIWQVADINFGSSRSFDDFEF
jgi:hypothetical protein